MHPSQLLIIDLLILPRLLSSQALDPIKLSLW